VRDLVDVPKNARSEMNIIPVDHIDQVLDAALLPASSTAPAKRLRSKRKREDSEDQPAEKKASAPDR